MVNTVILRGLCICFFVSFCNQTRPQRLFNINKMKFTRNVMQHIEGTSFIPRFFCPKSPVKNHRNTNIKELQRFFVEIILCGLTHSFVVGTETFIEKRKHDLVAGKNYSSFKFLKLFRICRFATTDFSAYENDFCAHSHASFTIRLCNAPKVTVNPNSSPSAVNSQGITSSAKGS